MKLYLLILIFAILSYNSYSQLTVGDSSIATYTVKLASDYNGPCGSSTTSKKFIVIKSDSKIPLKYVYILNENLQISSFNESKVYTIRGKIILREEWVYGCSNSRQKEVHSYIIPLHEQFLILDRNWEF